MLFLGVFSSSGTVGSGLVTDGVGDVFVSGEVFNGWDVSDFAFFFTHVLRLFWDLDVVADCSSDCITVCCFSDEVSSGDGVVGSFVVMLSATSDALIRRWPVLGTVILMK